MLLLLDEIDAALDEPNGARVAGLLAQLARHSQAVARLGPPEPMRVCERHTHRFTGASVAHGARGLHGLGR